MSDIVTIQDLKYQKMLTVWAARVADRQSRGLSVKDWCRENNVGKATFYKWQREVIKCAGQLQDNILHNTEQDFIEVDTAPFMNEAVPAASVQVAAIQIGRTTVQLYSNISADLAAAICRALK